MQRCLLLLALLPLTPALGLCGDCNSDGLVDVRDVLAAAHHASGLTPLSSSQLANCDVSPAGGDGRVEILDALFIAQRAVGLLAALPCSAGVTCPTATPDPVLLDTVVDYAPGPIINPRYTDPSKAVNGVRGGGPLTGSADVVSLGSASTGWGGHLTLRLANRVITNGPGPDFIIYENPFLLRGGGETAGFFETGVVDVSMDGVAWVRFPVVFDTGYAETDPRRYVRGFCGVIPVSLDTSVGQVPSLAGGGDPFDLDDVGLCEIRYIRIRDTGQVYPDLNFPPGDCDIDGVAALYTRADP